MIDRDREWIGRQLARLASVYDTRGRWRLFEPSIHTYKLLGEGEDEALQLVVDRIGRHLRLSAIPSARYEWGLKMAPEAAGEIMIGCHVKDEGLIRVPHFYVGKPYALGCILAHELSHQLNAVAGIWESVRDENERLTDLSAIATGLGKLVLNAMSAEAPDPPGTTFRLGYLEHDATLFAYELVNRQYRVSTTQATTALLPDIASRLTSLRSSI